MQNGGVSDLEESGGGLGRFYHLGRMLESMFVGGSVAAVQPTSMNPHRMSHLKVLRRSEPARDIERWDIWCGGSRRKRLPMVCSQCFSSVESADDGRRGNGT